MTDQVAQVVAMAISLLVAFSQPLVVIAYYCKRLRVRRERQVSAIHEACLEKEYLRLFHFADWELTNKKRPEEIRERLEQVFARKFQGDNSLGNYFLPFTLTSATAAVFSATLFMLYFNNRGSFPIDPGVLLPAITGALLYSFPHYIARYASLSLTPISLLWLFVRTWLSLVLGIFAGGLSNQDLRSLTALIGALLPLAMLDVLKKRVGKEMGGYVNAESEKARAELEEVAQHDTYLIEQLEYHGVRSVQELAFENPLRVFVETSLPLDTSLYMVDRASLHLYVTDAGIRESLGRYGIRTAVDLMSLLYKYPNTWIVPGDPLPAEMEGTLQELANVMKLGSVDALRNLIDIMSEDPKLTYLLSFWQTISRSIDSLTPDDGSRDAECGRP